MSPFFPLEPGKLTRMPKPVRSPYTPRCTSSRHTPGPLLLYIPPGEEYRYACPSCGHVTVLRGRDVTC